MAQWDTFPQWKQERDDVKGNVPLEMIVSFAPHRMYTDFDPQIQPQYDSNVMLAALEQNWVTTSVRCICRFVCRLNFPLYDSSRLQSFVTWHHNTYHQRTVDGRTVTLMFLQTKQLVCWPSLFVLIRAVRPDWMTIGWYILMNFENKHLFLWDICRGFIKEYVIAIISCI